MTNLKVRKEVTGKIAKRILKGEKINNYFLELIANEDVSVKEIADQVFMSKKGQREIKTQYGVIREISKYVLKSNDARLIFNFAKLYAVNDYFIYSFCNSIMKTKNIYYIMKCIEELNGAPIQLIVDEISNMQEDINSKDYLTKLYNLVQDVEGIQLDGLLNRMVKESGIKEIRELAERNNNPKLYERVIESKDVEQIYKLARYNPSTFLDKMIEVVLESGNSEYIFLFARDIPNIPLQRFLEALLKTDDVKRLRFFVRLYSEEVKDDLKEVCDRIKEIGSNEDKFEFAASIKGEPSQEIVNAILSTNDAYYIYKYAKRVEEYPDVVNKLEDAIIQLGVVKYVYKFAKDVKTANVRKLAEKICEIGDTEYIYLFALKVKDAPVELLKDAIVKSKDQVFIFKFARDIKSYSINFYDSLMEVILEGGDVQRILRYAEEIKGANITKLADAIIASKNPKYIYEFAQKVENAPVSKLINALAELN